jgi:hypothetical protein
LADVTVFILAALLLVVNVVISVAFNNISPADVNV